MKRLLWLGIGLAVGALAVRAVTRRARSLTPGGLADSMRETAGDLVWSVRSFVDDVREGMHEREDEIHAAFVEGSALVPDHQFEPDMYEEGNYRR